MLSIASLFLLAIICGVVSIHQANAFTYSRFVKGKKALVHLFETSSRQDSDTTAEKRLKLLVEIRKEAWVNSSVEYYSKVMREERRKGLGQVSQNQNPVQQEEFILMAKRHYFALRKIKDGKPFHAEQIYRKIIDELSHEEDGTCDHAKLAVTTLLLALLLQRLGDFEETRSVFLHFFRISILNQEDGKECACSAKVLQAYALFEMKRGNPLKSLELVKRAIQFDKSLAPVLQWKQFRDAMGRSKQIMSSAH